LLYVPALVKQGEQHESARPPDRRICIDRRTTVFHCAFAENSVYIGRHQSSSEDVNAIMQLTKDFRAALMDKNAKQMSTLMFSSNILFASPASAATVKMINDKEDVNFDGVSNGAYARFAQFVGTTRGSIEEKFYNVKITQDGHLA
jgi:hypothetical protein